MPSAMIVDDSPSIRDLLKHYLEQFNFRVVAQAENCMHALSLMKSLPSFGKPDLITLDLVMPGAANLDSLTFFRTVKQEYPGLPVVVITALPFEKTKQTFLAEGALDYIVKPFNRYSLEQLRRKLERLFPKLAPRSHAAPQR